MTAIEDGIAQILNFDSHDRWAESPNLAQNEVESPFLAGLNERQRQAVLHVSGPLLIVAGAGSGKTRVLTHRIAYLIREMGVSPWAILAITFTNKAAQEMRSRVGALVGENVSRNMWVCTFHSACVRILRKHAELLGYTRSFTIYDSADSQRLIALCINDAGLDIKRFTPRSVASIISGAKNELTTAAVFKDQAKSWQDNHIAEIFSLYEQRLRDANAMDFDDLLGRCVDLFRKHADVAQEYANRFEHVLVDEYQDTNHSQYELSKMWSSGSGNLCVVGDSDQSIYGFRGADIRNILEFERDFPSASIVNLEQNYRSTQPILDAANSLIKNNLARREKRLFTEQKGGERITCYEAENEHDEAAFVANEIERLENSGANLGDMAVFYRTNAQARVLEEVFVRSGTGYRVVGGTRFYDRKEIKDALGYLRLLVNPTDEVSLRRVINVPRRGIGDQTIAQLGDAAEEKGITLGEVVRQVDDLAGLTPRARTALSNFNEVIDDLRNVLETDGLSGAIEATWERTGYAAELRAQNSIEAQGRLENLTELLSVAAEFKKDFAETGYMPDYDDATFGESGPGTVDQTDTAPEPSAPELLAAFLEQVSLIADVDQVDMETSAATLMTLHNAKGLEFPIVFIVGMEEGVFPYARSLTEPDQIEEERRLAYVGITRARKRLYLAYAQSRSLWGSTSYNTVSRFLGEIPEELLDMQGGEAQVTTWHRDRDDWRGERGFERYGRWREGDRGGSGREGRRDAEPEGTVIGRGKSAGQSGVTESRGAGAALSGLGGTKSKSKSDSAPVPQLRRGDRVRHRTFGEGRVANVEGSGKQAQVKVDFDAIGRKQLVLAWARLEKV